MPARILTIVSCWKNERDLEANLAALYALNRHFLDQGARPLDMSGRTVRYTRELPGREEWLTLPILSHRGQGDCEDLAAAFSASYGGVPFIERVRPGLLHAMVEGDDGRIIDPSKLLGMGEE